MLLRNSFTISSFTNMAKDIKTITACCIYIYKKKQKPFYWFPSNEHTTKHNKIMFWVVFLAMVVELCYSMQDISHLFYLLNWYDCKCNFWFIELTVLCKNINNNVACFSDIWVQYWYYKSNIYFRWQYFSVNEAVTYPADIQSKSTLFLDFRSVTCLSFSASRTTL